VTELALQLPAKMRPFLSPMRHKVARGGRGGGKSWAVARILLARGVSEPIRWLCAREVQKSIKDSVHKLLADQAQAMGLGEFYEVQRDCIKGANGTEFLFAGLQDHTVDSIKSYEGCDGAWIEEAHSVSERSAEVLIPTIRKPGSELWWTYNPDQAEDYVHQRFVVRGDPNAVVVEINWRDNKWFPPELELERQQLKAINDDLYQHVWEGQCRSLAGLLFKRTWFKFYDALPEHLSVYMASDYAVSEDEGDFTEHGVAGLDENGELYLIDWYSDQAAPETWIDAAVAMVKRHKPQIWFEEKGVILRAVDAAITKRLRERGTWIMRESLASAGNKASRALGFAARASAGTVWLPRNAEWAVRLLNQLCAFNGEDGHVDDGVDVCSLLARGLDLMGDARVPAPTKPTTIVPFSRAHIEGLDRIEQHDAAQKRRYYR
jgi:PBSX family phage terminase large subunit